MAVQNTKRKPARARRAHRHRRRYIAPEYTVQGIFRQTQGIPASPEAVRTLCRYVTFVIETAAAETCEWARQNDRGIEEDDIAMGFNACYNLRPHINYTFGPDGMLIPTCPPTMEIPLPRRQGTRRIHAYRARIRKSARKRLRASKFTPLLPYDDVDFCAEMAHSWLYAIANEWLYAIANEAGGLAAQKYDTSTNKQPRHKVVQLDELRTAIHRAYSFDELPTEIIDILAGVDPRVSLPQP